MIAMVAYNPRSSSPSAIRVPTILVKTFDYLAQARSIADSLLIRNIEWQADVCMSLAYANRSTQERGYGFVLIVGGGKEPLPCFTEPQWNIGARRFLMDAERIDLCGKLTKSSPRGRSCDLLVLYKRTESMTNPHSHTSLW
jgi:hypothetical protein